LVAPGGAFGENSPNDLNLQKYHLNAVPNGLRHYAGFWHHALFNGYDFSHDSHPTVGYLLSAFFGILVISAAIAVVFGVARLARSRGEHGRDDELEGALT
jgi:cobalt/nickel transport system permease protein